MKINVDGNVLTLDENPVRVDGGDGKVIDLTFKKVIVDSLLIMGQKDAEVSGEEKLKRYKLAKTISQGGEVEVTTEEASLIKSQVNKVYSPLVYGRVHELIES